MLGLDAGTLGLADSEPLHSSCHYFLRGDLRTDPRLPLRLEPVL